MSTKAATEPPTNAAVKLGKVRLEALLDPYWSF